MTLTELNQLKHLSREIRHDVERLEALRTKAYGPGSPKLDGMPRSGVSDKTTDLLVAIADLEEKLAAKIARHMEEQNRLEVYLDGVSDSLTREIFVYRFVNGCSWQQVSNRTGGWLSADAARMIVIRYLDHHP